MTPVNALSRGFVVLGAALVALGLLMPLLRKLPYIGRLPGDIRIERPGFTLFLPLTTCILLSVALSLVLRLFARR